MKKRYFKIMLLIIFVLTIFDAVCTGYGVSSGYIDEGNAIARKMFEFSIPGTCVMIVVWTGLLLRWISSKSFKWIPYAMMLVLAVKLGIAGMHIYWLSYI